MSNLIKFPFVKVTEEKVVVGEKKEAEFVAFQEKEFDFKTVGQREAERILQNFSDSENGLKEPEFVEGLSVTNIQTESLDEINVIDELDSEELEQEEQIAPEELLREAQEEAERIIKEATARADEMMRAAVEEGKEKGYEDGISSAQIEIQRREQELEEMMQLHNRELADCVETIEERYVEVVISLLEKLTDVVLEDKEDLVLHLIRCAVNDMDASKLYKIRISPSDTFFLEEHKEELQEIVGEDVMFEIIEESGLELGQCIVETENQMVDCGFQTQLDMLAKDLRMLVR